MITLQINSPSSQSGCSTRRFNSACLAGAMLVTSGSLFAMVPPPEPNCAQIRAAIGVLQPANAELLRTIAVRKDCGFTAAEVYQAAYGDRPLPPREGRAEYPGRYHHLGENHIEDE